MSDPVNCDPATLAKAAACYCYGDRKVADAVTISLLCQLLEALSPSANMNYGFISGFGAGPFITLLASNTYTPILDYVASLVSGNIVANQAAGPLTIGTAGNYRVEFSVSASGGNNDQMESDVCVNGVPSDIIAGHDSSSANVNSRPACMAGSGIMALQAGAVLSIQAKNLQSTTMTISHVQLSVGTP